MAYRLRDAQASDEASIRVIVSSVMREYGLEPPPADEDRAEIVRVLLDESGAILGCGALYRLDRDDAEIRKMYFLPQARGKGYGRRMLQELIGAARERGYKRVVLETASVLKEAIALYRSAGFKPLLGPYPRERSGRSCDQVMALELAG